MTSGAPPIDVAHVDVDLDGHRILEDVSLRVEAGEFVGLVGPNGGGKTTFLRTLLGVVPPSRGDVRLFGESPRRLKEHARLAYVPQNVVHVDPRFPATAFEVALMGRVASRGLMRPFSRDDRDKVHAALEEMGVAHLAKRPIGKLSGGQRQRVFLAKALAGDPELLILDEPTTGVDPAVREDFYQLLDRLNHARGLTLILVSHDTPAITAAAHRLVALNRSVVYDGPAEEFEETGGLGTAYGIHVHHHDHEEVAR